MSDSSTPFARRKRILDGRGAEAKAVGVRNAGYNMSGDLVSGTNVLTGLRKPIPGSSGPSDFFNYSKPRIPTQPTVAQRGPDAAPRPGALVVPAASAVPQIQSPAAQTSAAPAAPAAPAVPPSPAVPAASAVPPIQSPADAATAPRAVTSRAGGAMPTGMTDITSPGMAERGARAIDGPRGSGFIRKTEATDAELSARGAGIYENGKRVMPRATTGPYASVTMPNGKVESTDFTRPAPPRTGNAFDDGADMQAEAKPAPEPARVIKARAEFAAAHEGPGVNASDKQNAAGMANYKAKQKALARAMNPALVNAQDELEKARYAGSGRPADFKRFKTAQAKVAAMMGTSTAQKMGVGSTLDDEAKRRRGLVNPPQLTASTAGR